MQVEGQHEISLLILMATGVRVSNTYATCLLAGDNPEKFGLIPHNIIESHVFMIKNLLLTDGHAYD